MLILLFCILFVVGVVIYDYDVADNGKPTTESSNVNNVCDIRHSPYNAIGDNRTDDTIAIQTAIDDETCDVVFLSGPGTTYRITSSLALTSNLTLQIDSNTTLFSAQPLCDPHKSPPSRTLSSISTCQQHPKCPTLYWKTGPTAILCGKNLSNVVLTGVDSRTSIIDGGGWSWYDAGIRNKSLEGAGPRSYEFAWSENLTISNLTFVNSPSWTIHPTFCNNVLVEYISIRNPRFTPNTDGFDPDSSSNVILRHSYIDTGDDGISIKSQNSTVHGSEHVMVPARNIHVYDTKIVSRNVCVGSQTFGGVFDVVVEDCEIGNDNGSAPWAIKYKSHQSFPGPMKNHTWKRLRVGNIAPNSYQQPNGGYFISIELRYHPLIPNRTCHPPWDCPIFEDVSFEDIVVTRTKRAGDINGFYGNLLRGLRFKNVTIDRWETGWSCGYVNLTTFEAESVIPELRCNDGPSHTRLGGDVERTSNVSSLTLNKQTTSL